VGIMTLFQTPSQKELLHECFSCTLFLRPAEINHLLDGATCLTSLHFCLSSSGDNLRNFWTFVFSSGARRWSRVSLTKQKKARGVDGNSRAKVSQASRRTHYSACFSCHHCYLFSRSSLLLTSIAMHIICDNLRTT